MKIKTEYREPEVSLGDRQKVVMLQVFDWLECDNLQVAEMVSLIKASVEEVFSEKKKTYKKKPKRRKRPSCGDDYKTLSTYGGMELNIGNSIHVIKEQIRDMRSLDGLTPKQIIYLIGDLIESHIDENDELKK